MNYQETVTPDQETELPSEQLAEQPQETQEVEQEDKKIPLHVLQKERRKRQEAEEKARFYEEQQKAAEDDSRYDSATKEDLGRTQEETIRIIEERKWKRDNPEKAQRIDEELKEFLKQRPNLRPAIEYASNRYEEAWTLMSALSPKQQKELSSQKPQAPGSPSGVPKAAALSETVDLMNMNDSEFNAWRKQMRKRK